MRLALALCLFSVVHGYAEEVIYRDGSTACRGYLASPAVAGGAVPGVVVLPAWKGLDDHARTAADQLARLGYVALAADIYGEGTQAKDAAEAGKLAAGFKTDRALYRRRIAAALDALRGLPHCRPGSLAVIGYCFGGTGALEAARAGLPVRVVVSFHGGLAAGGEPTVSPIVAKVLVLHGADDPLVPPTEVAAFMDEMRLGKADWQLVAYGGARHSFTDPNAGDDRSKPVAYDAPTARRSWEAMRAALAEAFAP